MRTSTLAALAIAGAMSAHASAQATLPRTGPNWTFPNGFGQRWVTPAPRNSFAPRFRVHSGFNTFGHGPIWHSGGFSRGHVEPFDHGGHIFFYTGPGVSYRAGSVPFGRFDGTVIWVPPAQSSTACWF